MARNGSGTYNLYTPGNPVVTGTTISSSAFNNTLSDIATALTQSIAADGQTPITANIPFNSKKITGLAAGTTSGDALSYGQAIAGSTGTFTGALSATTHSLSAQPSFNAQRITSSLSLPGGAITDIVFNTANSNVSSSYDTSTGIFTAPTTGVYLFTGGVLLQNSSGVNTAILNNLYFSKNNDTSNTAGLYFAFNMSQPQGASIGPGGNAFFANGSIVVAMTAGDTMRVKCDMGSTFAMVAKITSYLSGCQLF